MTFVLLILYYLSPLQELSPFHLMSTSGHKFLQVSIGHVHGGIKRPQRRLKGFFAELPSPRICSSRSVFRRNICRGQNDARAHSERNFLLVVTESPS